MSRPARPLALCSALLLLGLLHLAAGQRDSPLLGYGIPHANTSTIFISAYLDRLLLVDDRRYRHENVMYFYLSWTDPSAPEILKKHYVQSQDDPKNYSCKFSCSNTVNGYPYCCDGIYLPSFTFKNTEAFPEDRLQPYTIYITQSGKVLWETRVHGSYYQRMNFKHHPFDYFACVIDLKFEDTAVFNPEHPGRISLESSSMGRKLFTRGQGDDSEAWSVVEVSGGAYSYTDAGVIFEESSDIYSHEDDPMALSPAPSRKARRVTKQAVSSKKFTPNAFTGDYDQRFMIFLTVERFWRPSLINNVLPVVLVAFLAMFVFFLDINCLNDRLQIIVGLFLSLTAVQFVLIGAMPTSSYIVPTQQLVLCTYVYLFALSLESIVVHYIANHKDRHEASKSRSAARRQARAEDIYHKKAVAAAKKGATSGPFLRRQQSAATSEGSDKLIASGLSVQAAMQAVQQMDAEKECGDVEQQQLDAVDVAPSPPRAAKDAGAAAADDCNAKEASPRLQPMLRASLSDVRSEGTACDSMHGGPSDSVASMAGRGEGQPTVEAAAAPLRAAQHAVVVAPPPKRRFGITRPGIGSSLVTFATTRTMSGRLSSNATYAAAIAHLVDLWACAAFILLYILTAVIIFTTQRGYIDLWGTDT